MPKIWQKMEKPLLNLPKKTISVYYLQNLEPGFQVSSSLLIGNLINNYIPANTTMGAPRATEMDLGKVLNTSLMSLTPGQVMNKEQDVKVSP